MAKIKNILESLFLILIFCTLLWTSVATLWDHRIKHDFPYGYMASDTFQHQVRVESIKLMGNYKFEAPYIVAGYNDNPGFYMPIMYHLGVIFSYLTGLETYDITYLMLFIFGSLTPIMFYVIIKRFNTKVAILSLPFSILLFSRAPYTGFTWGHWPTIISHFLLIAFCFSVINLNLDKFYFLFAVLLSGVFMTHSSEAAYGMFFVFLFFGVNFLIYKKIEFSKLKKLALGMLIFFVLSFYYLIVFKNTWLVIGGGYSFSVMPRWEGSIAFYLPDFGILLVFLVIGAIASIFFFKKKKFEPTLIGITLLIFGLANYYGYPRQAFDVRILWPVYFSFFIALGLYVLLRLLIKVDLKLSLAISVVILILLNIDTGIAWIPHTERYSSPGIMNKYEWDMYKWFQSNVDSGKVLFFYGDSYGQNAILRNTHLPPYMVSTKYFVSALQNKTVKRYYRMSLLGDHHGVNYVYRKSFFEYGSHAREEESKDPNYYYGWMGDICDFDYYVFDKASRQPVLAQYNILIAKELLKAKWIKPAYDNELVIVLQNNKLGEDCLNETKIDISN